MEMCPDLAALHGYLCADGYVIKNPFNSPYRYFRIGLRNTEPVLLFDFKERFERLFGDSPTISRVVDRCQICVRKYYEFFTTQFGSFYSHEWQMPALNKESAAINDT